ncbi:hypothetical protein COU59_00510 [Candidatus Pacearchaeota archaeon CG10_big_fil_rev_8_21_14_0_10_34_12]|nr:MAG: hypothetical protein COU59_00510 [Candidatus Pacearchaeota archaeon CG10_big_fil_rev_8_21_14_0_10_34_12]
MKKVVTIGGGTGQYTLLRGLKKYGVDLKAIVSVTDNGGSSGELRTEFGVLPPGDLRNCMLALADEVNLKDLVDLFDYRFPKSNNGKFSNHSLGNLIITALHQKHKNMADAINVASKILNLSGEIIPVSVDETNIYAKTENGDFLNGEVEINYSENAKNIKELWLEPKAHLYKNAYSAIKEADLIVICPGELYGSILPNFLIKGFRDAIMESSAKIVYVCNLVTKQGTHGFKASNFLNIIENYLGKKVNYIICNTKKPTQKIVDKYKEEDSFFVEPDIEDERAIKEDLLLEFEINSLFTARHDSDKIAKLIMNLL